jgi:hypothetical protein
MIHTPHLNHINPDLVPPPAPTYITNGPWQAALKAFGGSQ